MQLPKALAFDVFGTVVDWRTGIADQVTTFLSQHLPGTDPALFADEWRSLYPPAMEACRSGRRPFTLLDRLHFETLVQLVESKGVRAAQLDEGELLDLSYANIALMIAMNRFNGLVWDAILGAEFSRSYKPAPQAYLRSAEALCLEPRDLCLVASHHSDLAAARACGLQTAYVDRPMEYGGALAPDRDCEQAWEWQANDLMELARQLGAA